MGRCSSIGHRMAYRLRVGVVQKLADADVTEILEKVLDQAVKRERLS